jgi:hypothetical protein
MFAQKSVESVLLTMNVCYVMMIESIHLIVFVKKNI